MSVLLQNMVVIIKHGSYYKMRHLLLNESAHSAKAEKYWFQETMKIYSTV